MQEKYGAARMVAVRDLWHVLVGRAGTQAEAETLAGAVKGNGKAFESAFVARMEAGE